MALAIGFVLNAKGQGLFPIKNSPDWVSNVTPSFKLYRLYSLSIKFYIYDFKKILTPLRINRVKRIIEKKFGCSFNRGLENWVTLGMKSMFKNILKNNYDFIVMFYLYTGKLLDNVEIKAKKINFMEDFLSITHFHNNSNMNIGASINSEIQMCCNFDEIAFISSDEKFFFQKLLPPKVNCHFVPHIMQANKGEIAKEKILDVLFLGHKNLYNIEGIEWFLANVHQHIAPDITIYIGGNICDYIPDGYNNVKKLGFVENIDELYKKTKVCICPLLNGTGMKIKVVEAMNYGIPVVCTSRGVDGFPDKTRNGCLVTDDPRRFALQINSLCKDESFYTQCAHDVSAYANEYLSYEKNVETLDRIFDV